MATKQEIAEGLTVAELRELADREGVDLTGLTAKQDIADAVASSVSKDALESAAGDGGEEQKQGGAFAQPAGESALAGASAVAGNRQSAGRDPIDEDVPLADADLPPLGPPNPEPVATGLKVERSDTGSITADPVAQQKAGVSPADLEVPGLGPGGPAIIVKQNPETPSIHQIQGALAAVPGPSVPNVTVLDHEGEEVPHNLGTDDLALINSRAVASNSGHPAHTTEGHWDNPLLRDLTDEEREADQKAYAERFGK